MLKNWGSFHTKSYVLGLQKPILDWKLAREAFLEDLNNIFLSDKTPIYLKFSVNFFLNPLQSTNTEYAEFILHLAEVFLSNWPEILGESWQQCLWKMYCNSCPPATVWEGTQSA